jgi:hypothetical protein
MLNLDEIFDIINEDLVGAESTRFRNMLKKKIVKFKYRKKSDNSIRTANGTLKQDMLPAYSMRKRAKPNSKRFIYWDVDKKSFRSFLRKNFIGIDDKNKQIDKSDEK